MKSPKVSETLSHVGLRGVIKTNKPLPKIDKLHSRGISKRYFNLEFFFGIKLNIANKLCTSYVGQVPGQCFT